MASFAGEELDEFLSRPHLAHFATVRASGTPHVVPVWVLWEKGRAYVMTDTGSVKLRNIHRNPAVSVCVSTSDRPSSFVTVEGTASTGTEDIEGTVHRICFKYSGTERGTEFARELLASGRVVLITITPNRIISWKGESG